MPFAPFLLLDDEWCGCWSKFRKERRDEKVFIDFFIYLRIAANKSRRKLSRRYFNLINQITSDIIYINKHLNIFLRSQSSSKLLPLNGSDEFFIKSMSDEVFLLTTFFDFKMHVKRNKFNFRQTALTFT